MPSDPHYIVQEQAAHIDRLQREIEQLKLDKSSLTGQLREARASKESSNVSIKREEDVPLLSLSTSSSSTSDSKKRARTSDSPIQPTEASSSPGDRLLEAHRQLQSLETDYNEYCALISDVGICRAHPMMFRAQKRILVDMKALRKEIHSIIFPDADHKFDDDGLAHVCGIEHVPIEKRYYLRYERDEEDE